MRWLQQCGRCANAWIAHIQRIGPTTGLMYPSDTSLANFNDLEAYANFDEFADIRSSRACSIERWTKRQRIGGTFPTSEIG